jgi:hypothetical protein
MANNCAPDPEFGIHPGDPMTITLGPLISLIAGILINPHHDRHRRPVRADPYRALVKA